VADLGYPKGSLLAGGELVGTLSNKHPPEHQIVHLELSAMYEPLLIALECLAVPCIFNSSLSSSFVNKVDIIGPVRLYRITGHRESSL
jgi:hypothetical protein